jgi:predicted DNA-binding transcriptional regulator YafY
MFWKEEWCMGKDLSSIRISRLNRLMQFFFTNRRGTTDRILDELGYRNGTNTRRGAVRALQRDLEYLRNEFQVEVGFDRSKKFYVLRGTGQYLLNLGLSESEVRSLAAGLALVRRHLPDLALDAERIWRKVAEILPEALLREGEHPAGALSPDVPESAGGDVPSPGEAESVPEENPRTLLFAPAK